MSGNYTLKVITEFAAAHTLRDYPGACSRLHGHNWKVEVEVQGRELDNIGMVIDFREIKRHAREVGDRLDHRYLNELEPFDTLNPTAENISRHFFDELSARLNGHSLRVHAVTLWETDRACVRYSRDDTPASNTNQ